MTLHVYMPETIAKGNCLSLTKTFPDSSKSSDPAKHVHSLSDTVGPMERYLQRADRERRRTATTLVIRGMREDKIEVGVGIGSCTGMMFCYAKVVRLLSGLLDRPLTPGCVTGSCATWQPQKQPSQPQTHTSANSHSRHLQEAAQSAVQCTKQDIRRRGERLHLGGLHQGRARGSATTPSSLRGPPRNGQAVLYALYLHRSS